MRILSTKKLQPNQKQYLLNAGLSVLDADFIATQSKTFELEEAEKNLIFTSSNAVASFMQNKKSSGLKSNRVFCVGLKTKELLLQNSFHVEVCTDYAEELAKVIVSGYKEEAFTFFSGNLRMDTIPKALKNAEVKLHEIEVYETILTPHKVNAGINGILFFSPSGVESFLKGNDINQSVCFCIGTTTAKALKGITDNIVVANQPSVENVIIQCINYYKL